MDGGGLLPGTVVLLTRRSRGISQIEMASVLGVSRATISQLENSSETVPNRFLVAWATGEMAWVRSMAIEVAKSNCALVISRAVEFERASLAV